MRIRVRRTSALAAACWLGARTAEAKYLHQTPADILQIPGIPAALVVCIVGLLMLRSTSRPRSEATRSHGEERRRPGSGARRRDPREGRRPDPRWALVGAFIVFIYGTVPIGYQIASAIVVRIGHNAWQNALNAVGAALGAVFAWHAARQRERRRWPVVAALAAIAGAYAYFFAVLDVPVKRIHFMEYSFLSALVYRALRARDTPTIYVWCALAAMLVGAGEETISLGLDRRFGAVSDVIWDTTGGILGTLVLKYVLIEVEPAPASPAPATAGAGA
jgi:VanZ like protein